MLSREVCVKCVNTYRYYKPGSALLERDIDGYPIEKRVRPWNKQDEENWNRHGRTIDASGSRGGFVWCPKRFQASRSTDSGAAFIGRNAPEGCPHVVEHTVSQESC